MLRLDLMTLETPQRFQDMCYRLAKREFPNAHAVNFASWDRGSDIISFWPPPYKRDDIIWQCKFTKSLGSTTKSAILKSLKTVEEHCFFTPPAITDPAANLGSAKPRARTRVSGRPRPLRRVIRWILCLPVDPTGVFLGWLREVTAHLPFKCEVWGKTELLRKLEENPDVVETYFFAAYAELREHFQTEELELVEVRLYKKCQWRQPDPKVLRFERAANVASPDLVLDVIIRNRGAVETAILGISAQVRDHEIKAHGIPDEGLLLPRITYKISIRHGKPGDYFKRCEPPLRVGAGRLERFKIRVVDTGYSWLGVIRLGLRYTKQKELRLPWMRLYT